MVKSLAVLALPLLIAGCSPYKPEQVSMGGNRLGIPLPPRTYAQAVEVRDAALDTRITILGSEHPWPGHPYNAQRLRSYKAKPGGAVTHELYVDSFYDEHRTGGGVAWSRAIADDGSALSVIFIDRKRIECGLPNACPRRELFTIELSDALLRSRARSGLRIRIYGSSGHEALLAIGSGQITEQLAALDRL